MGSPAASAPADVGGVLRTRLVPPRLPPGCLPRDELVERVVAGLEGPVVLVVAGAGYGKSVLAAQVAEAAPWPVAWCSCNERIDTPGLLVAHVTAAIAQRVPGFGAGLAIEGHAEALAAAVCKEIGATIADDLVLVLDDVHTLPGDVAVALGRLVRDLPREIHLLLLGRSAPRIPLSRLRPLGLIEIGERELAFSEPESRALLEAAGLAGDMPEAARLHEATEGWPAGLLIAARAEREVAPSERVAAGRVRLFDYLAEEVIAGQDESTRRFLLATAVVERFTPQLAADLAGRRDARRTIGRLVAKHLFTIPLDSDGEWYRYHHLFQAFLRRRLAEEGPERVAQAHLKASASLLAHGEPVEAARHALLAGDHAAAVAALEPVAEGIVASPHADTLGQWLDEIPRELWSDRPSLVLAHASLLFQRAEYEAAFAALESAVDELIHLGEHERAAVALHRLLLAYATAGGRHHRAIETGNRFIERIPPDTRGLPAGRLRMASLLGYAGRLDEAEEELCSVERLTEASAPVFGVYTQLLRAFYIDYPLGRNVEALAALRGAIRVLDEGDDPLAQLPYAWAYVAIIQGQLGRFEESLADVPRLVESAERVGLARVAAPVVAWLRFGAYVGLERWKALESALDEARPLFARLGVAVRSHLFHAADARRAAESGEVADALEAIDAARAGLAAYAYPFEEAIVLPDLARAATVVGRPAVGEALLEDARTAARRAQAPLPAARAAMMLAHATPGAGGDALLAEAIELTFAHALHDVWKRRERPLAAQLLARAIERRIGPEGAAAELAAACGGEVLERCAALLERAAPASRARLAEVAAAASGSATIVGRLARDADPQVRRAARRTQRHIASRSRPPIRIGLLGGFSLQRAGEPVPGSAIGRQKAKVVLSMLACEAHAVHRDTILSRVWPDLSPERGLASLHSTLHTLRRLLEPDLARGTSSSRVVADGEAYRLVLGDEGDGLDVREFLELARLATLPGTGIEELAAAEAAYAGPLLPEWPDARWAAGRRLEVDEAHVEVCERLAEELAAAGRATAAIARYRKLLAIEPEREGWHRALMRVYVDAGDRALALRQFHACRAHLRRELGVEPGPQTRALYTAVLREEGMPPPPA